MQLDYTSLDGLLAAAEQAGRPLSELVLAQQAAELEQPPEQVYDRMARCYQVMADGVAPGCDPDLRSASGLSGGSAAKMPTYCCSSTSSLANLLAIVRIASVY